MNERVWGILVDSFPKMLRYGVEVTIPLAAASFALALLIAVLVALIQYAKVPVLTQICRFYIWVVRGTPVLVQLYLVFYGLPSVGVIMDAWLAAWLVLGFNEGAYMAETVRGALESVSVYIGIPSGVEAARKDVPDLINLFIPVVFFVFLYLLVIFRTEFILHFHHHWYYRN